MIYRGQKYGDPIGVWWTTSLDEAVSYAMSRGANRTWVVVALDEDDEQWLRKHICFHRASETNKLGDWLRIPLDELKLRWRGVKIIDGAIGLEDGHG